MNCKEKGKENLPLDKPVILLNISKDGHIGTFNLCGFAMRLAI